MYIHIVVINSALKFDVGEATDAEEASALGYRDYHIDVYSNSWGPPDFGFIVDGPGPLVQSTLKTGITEVHMAHDIICVWVTQHKHNVIPQSLCCCRLVVNDIYTTVLYYIIPNSHTANNLGLF